MQYYIEIKGQSSAIKIAEALRNIADAIEEAGDDEVVFSVENNCDHIDLECEIGEI